MFILILKSNLTTNELLIGSVLLRCLCKNKETFNLKVPAENLKGSYPRVGYSFEILEAATFKHSFPTFYTYRYKFDTI